MRPLPRLQPRPRAAVPALRVLPPVEMLLTQGGDGRLHIDAVTGLNPYGCRPAPRPEALHFSSSTASSVSERGWRRVNLVRERLAHAGEYPALVEENRTELKRLLRLDGTGADIVFAPSGTDAALLAVAVARTDLRTPLTSLIAAVDETGSGARHAAGGRHFAASTAQGRAVVAGEPIAGIADGVDLAAVPLREPDGSLVPPAELDRRILAQVGQAVAAGSTVLLHAMDHSKLGNRCPGDACLAGIERSFGARVRVVVDACQGRLARERIRAHLQRGRMVLITGSKFFSGPPLSGALLLPHELVRGMERASSLPPGLADYSVESDWPSGWRAAQASLGRHENVGQLMRWSAALEEMSAWFAVPGAVRRAALAEFASSVPRAADSVAAVEPLRPPLLDDPDFPVPTIFPFFVRHHGVALSPSCAAKLYHAMNRDVTSILPRLDNRERALAALPCHIGQPVCVDGPGGTRGALRVSASARIVAEGGCGMADGLGLVFQKLDLLVREFERIERAF
jgi:hypothetical protein